MDIQDSEEELVWSLFIIDLHVSWGPLTSEAGGYGPDEVRSI